ncbi:MAG: hypothetical protein V1768_01020 [Patescibacteria group bacterium]|nr:hypothetical protein [Patescibacteria group bacterium]MBU1160745.1 hypothetical protein [Patescibacteria group bacterium]MBU1683914.1 hypothetical protein [Patescibacteria group bacterium]MBU1778405.1 hypothetical protein [Patescibacteria group bacterium]MBU1987136.1 hypothetical protein [Patescibacteria group bacterium]
MEAIIEEIKQLVKNKMREQGAYDRDAYKQFVEESIEYYQTKGVLTDDDNLQFIEERLLSIWDEVKNEF